MAAQGSDPQAGRQAQAQPQPQPGQASDDEISAVIGLIATGAALGAVATALAGFLKVPLTAAVGALGIVGAGTLASFKQDMPSDGSSGVGTSGGPVAIERRANLRYRAAYIINAARRIAGASDKKAAVARERTYWAGHQRASARRTKMAKRMAAATRKFGPVIGWYAKMDNRTTAECRAANGRNFLAAQPPVIGYPGTVHMHCRCLPGAPHPGGKMVDASTTVQNSDAASGFHR